MAAPHLSQLPYSSNFLHFLLFSVLFYQQTARERVSRLRRSRVAFNFPSAQHHLNILMTVLLMHSNDEFCSNQQLQSPDQGYNPDVYVDKFTFPQEDLICHKHSILTERPVMRLWPQIHSWHSAEHQQVL